MIQTSHYLVSALVMGLALLVWRARPTSATNRLFGVFTLVISIWVFGIATMQSAVNLDFAARLTFAAASLIPPTFLAFVQYYPTASQWSGGKIVLYINLGCGLAIASISLATRLVVTDVTMTATVGVTRETGPLYGLYAIYFLTTWLVSIAVVIAKWTRARGFSRGQLHYLALGVILSTAGGITTNLILPLLTRSSAFAWIGPYFALILIAMVAHAIIRHRLMDVRLVIHRGLTFALALAVSLIPVACLLVIAWPRLSDHLAPDELVAFVIAVVVVGLLIPLTRDAAGRLLDRYVYRTHVNYQRTLREASEALTRVLDLKVLLQFVNHTVATSTNSEGAAVYLKGGTPDPGSPFRRAIAEKRHAQSNFDTPEEAPPEIIAALTRTRDLLLTDEIEHERPTPERERLHEALSRLNWALVLPLVCEEHVIGAIVAGPKLAGDPFYPQDLDLLMTLANQAGVAVKNAQLYAQVLLANEHLNNIVSTIESGVVAVDATGQITLFNPAAQQLTGLTAERVRFQPLSVLPACVGGMLAEAVTEGNARTEPEVQLSDGVTTRPIICTTSPLHDQTGAVLGAVAVFSDLTPLKALEVERQRAERLAYFEMLASGIAHEIKNPLVAVKAFSQLMPRRRTDDRFVAEYERVVNHEIATMERLLDRLRTLSRPGERPHPPIDLRAPVGDAIEAMRPVFAEKSIALSAAMGSSPCTVLADHSELEQLFLNLLMNAHEVTPPEGSVRVEVATTPDRVIVAVVDTGPGVPPELLERVFDPFFSTKERGTGLGLAICASIAQTHDARLKVANREAGGAVFTVDFPLAVAATLPVPA
jgi:two-component system nitrogen regulation sensor histidine kinase GlnL